jgi:hypothetical protein
VFEGVLDPTKILSIYYRISLTLRIETSKIENSNIHQRERTQN